jgi:raffinose/stachyose/melibiose transport system permease protein
MAASTKAPASRRSRFSAARAAMYLILLFVTIVIVVPISFAVLGGFKESRQMFFNPVGLPDPWVFDHYLNILRSEEFWRQILNSLIVAAVTTVGTVALGAMAAFVFARFAFRGREFWFTLFMLGLMFPVAVAILPLYILVRDLNLDDTLMGVAIPQLAFGLPVTIFILRSFFRNVPAELEDAAAIYGCSPAGFFWRILLPISRPALATVAVLAIVASWNAFFLPLLVLTSPDTWTLPLGVNNFRGTYAMDTAAVMAFTTLSMVPALIFYIFAERQLTGGLTAGSVKG